MRHTNYVPGYGYMTGNGIFDTFIKGITTVATSDKTKDIITEGVKAAAKSAGDKAGSKIVEKAFNKTNNNKPSTTKNNKKKSNNNNNINDKNKTNEEMLKEIYGNSILGRGIRKLK